MKNLTIYFPFGTIEIPFFLVRLLGVEMSFRKLVISAFIFISLFILLFYMNRESHNDMLKEFSDNYIYYEKASFDTERLKKVYYCEYLDNYERMWFQYEELQFLDDSTFKINTRSALFTDNLFTMKYKMNLLEFVDWENHEVYKIRGDSVFNELSGAKIGYLKIENKSLSFHRDRP